MECIRNYIKLKNKTENKEISGYIVAEIYNKEDKEQRNIIEYVIETEDKWKLIELKDWTVTELKSVNTMR